MTHGEGGKEARLILIAAKGAVAGRASCANQGVRLGILDKPSIQSKRGYGVQCHVGITASIATSGRD